MALFTALLGWVKAPKNWVKLVAIAAGVLAFFEPQIVQAWPQLSAVVAVALVALHEIVKRFDPVPVPVVDPNVPGPAPSVIETILAWVRDGLKDVKSGIAPPAETRAQALKIVSDAFDQAEKDGAALIAAEKKLPVASNSVVPTVGA